MKSAKLEKQTEKPKYGMWSNSAYMIRLAWTVCRSVLWLCLLQAALAVAANLLELFIAPAVLGAIEKAVPLRQLLWTIFIFAGGLVLTGALSSYVNENTLFGRIEVRLKLIAYIRDKYAMTSYPNTGNQKILKLLENAQRAVGGNRDAGEAIWTTLTSLLQNAVGFLIYLAMLSSLDPLLTTVTLATALISYFAGKRINGWGYRHREEEAEYSKQLYYLSQKSADMTLAKDIRIFGMHTWLNDLYCKTLRLYQAFQTKAQKVYIWSNIIDIVLTLLRNGIAYAYLIHMTLQNGLSASQFLLYFSAVGGFTTWITGILSQLSTLHQQSLGISSIREFVEIPEPFRFEEGQSLKPAPESRFELCLQDVSFRYPEAEKDTLSHINLTIRPGEKIAVVGRNGAGKTTLIKLLCGFLDPTEGAVLLNGQDIRQYNRRDYYRCFSAVFQDFSLLAATVAENVAQADETLNLERVQHCIDLADLTETLKNLPRGLETHLGRSVFEDAPDLSGGQLQRLMLARALYKDAPILVLDEPTAALDPLAESEIYQKYNALSQGKTSIFISHRLASTRFCDRILLIDGGVIAEEGTHEQLLTHNGKYAKLFEVQSRYYQKGGAEHEEE
jgi:ATP-binding cassette subfamily B protein